MAATHEQLRRAADLISQPLLLEMLLAAENGRKPHDAAPPDADPAVLRAALQRLATMGVINSDAPASSADTPLALTPRGVEFIHILRELEAAVPTNPIGEP